MKSFFILTLTFAFTVYNIHCTLIPAPGKRCPKDKPRIYCFVAPCLFAKCPAYPTAKCVDNYCGGCNADFYFGGRKVDCCNIICPLYYQPVCGSDGKTYGNTCELGRANCKSSTKIYVRFQGPCYCLLPHVVGPCRASIPRYFYNPRTKQCELFYYGGCKGNKNNFKTKKACEATCARAY